MDIRKFFKPLSEPKKNGNEVKRKPIVLDSDSDEDPLPKKAKKRNRIIDSDSDDENPLNISKKKRRPTPKKKHIEEVTLKKATASDFFGSSKVQRSDKQNSSRESKRKDSAKRQLSEDIFDDELPETKKSKTSENHSDAIKSQSSKLKNETPSPDKKENVNNNIQKIKEKVSCNSKNAKKEIHPKEKKYKTEDECEKTLKKSSTSKKANTTPSKASKSDKSTPKVKAKDKTPSKTENLKNQSVRGKGKYNIEVTKSEKSQPAENPDLDVSVEDKGTPSRKTALYKKFLQRSGPQNPGSKIVPEGTPTCLSGLTFVITGVMESLDRTELSEIIKERGGRVTTSVSKNTSYIILGIEPGESKTKKGEQLGTKFLSEDEFLDLIRTCAEDQGKPSSKKGEGKIKTPKKTPSLKKDSSKPQKSGPMKSISNMSSPSSTTSTLSQATFGSQSPQLSSQRVSSDGSEGLWVDKYKPQSLKNIIGQQGESSNAKKLLNWLKNWNHNQSGKVKLTKPSPWSKDNTGAYYKCALLSGPPGVGKTTTVSLVCNELGYTAMETNASDTRSKKSLKEDVSELLSNKTLTGFSNGTKTSKNHVLVMDEVDGMAGNEDRGGMAELISLIKSSKTPIICMCNDRNSPKIRSLANYCFDLRFSKPRVEQIRGAMMSVCYKEGIKIKPESLDEIIIGSNQDIRQILNHLSVWSASNKHMDVDQTHKDSKSSKKDLRMGPWDVCTKVFSESAHNSMSIHDKSSLFFHDFSIGPLFVQENYLKVAPHCARGNSKKLLEQIAKTASSLADGDIVEKSIRSKQAWSLLPTQALYSSLLPGQYMEGHMNAQIEFPKWLGNNSKEKKFDRLSQELHTHMILRISGTKRDIVTDYSKPLRDMIIKPLAKLGSDGVSDAVNAMISHDLVREDLESILELSTWSGNKDPMAPIESKVKAAFTRAINKSGHLNPYGGTGFSKKNVAASDFLDDENVDESEDEDNDDITKDPMIMKGKKANTQAPKKGTKSKSKQK